MGNSERVSEYTSITENGDPLVGFYAGEEWKEVVDEFVEESPFPNRSVALRALTLMGMRSFVLDDPRRSRDQDEMQSSDGFNPVTIRELIPEGEENAISLKGEFTDMLDEKILEIVEDDPAIKRSGWKVYR